MFLNEGLFSLSLGKQFEPLETCISRTFIKGGNTVVDLGANVGYYTLLFSGLVGPNGKVIAFEPSPANYKILESNIQINSLSNVVTNQIAIADTRGKTKLYLSVNPGDNRIYAADSENKNESVLSTCVEVETLDLDSYFTGSDEEIDFMKMDIQGAEYSALLGMQSVLTKNRNVKILAEFFPKLLMEYGANSKDYLDTFERHGFHFYNIDETVDRIELTSATELMKRYSPQEDKYTNLFMSREKIDDSTFSKIRTQQNIKLA